MSSRDVVQSAYQHTWWSLMLRGILALAVGVFIFQRPLESVASFALVIALWALFGGIIEVVRAFDLRPLYSRWWLPLLSGLVSIGFGVAAIYYYPVLSLTFAVVWVIAWLIATGALAIYSAIEERRAGLPSGWTMFFGLASIVTGAFAASRPYATVGAIMGLIAGFAIVAGVLHVYGAFKLSSLKKEITASIGSPRAI